MRRARAVAERPVIGFDFSPTSTGAVWLPPGWTPGDWSSIVADTFDTEAEAGDLYAQACAALDFVDSTWMRTPAKFPTIFYEQYAFSRGNSSRSIQQHELGGMVKFALRDKHAVVVAHAVVASGARKLLFGPTKRAQVAGSKGWKKFIEAELARMGCPLGSADERDAFVAANAGRHALGLPCLAHGG